MQFGSTNYEIKVWNGEKLGKYISCDTETTVVPFHLTPELVTIQAFDGSDTAYYIPLDKVNLFFNKHYDNFFIFHNASFDLDVLSKYLGNRNFSYDLIDRSKVRDTSVLYRLLHLAQHGYVPFKYNLALLSDKYLGVPLEKDARRENFAQFLGKSISDIPCEYLEYGAKDVIATYYVYNTLMGLIKNHDSNNSLLTHDIQVKGELALTHIHKNGIGFDLLARDAWLSDMDKQIETEKDILACWGWVRGSKGIKDRYEAIVSKLGIANKLPKTEDGSISSKAADLCDFKHLPFIASFLKFGELEKATSFVRDLNNSKIHPRYNSILNTGRTSCSKPNIQQLPRIGGIRELFIPTKKENVFIDIDYSSLELATLAQVTYSKYGESKMRDLINEGRCLHYYTASSVYNKPESEITKEERQFSKIPNFGFGANMAPATFVDYCAGYGVDIDEVRAKEVKDAWLETYPEMKRFFNIGQNKSSVTLTGRKRNNCSYTAFLNNQFQGLAADGFKLALYEVDKAGYTIAAEIHDQIVIEVPRVNAEKEMPILQNIMEKAMQSVCPDVKITTEGQIIERFTK